MNAAAARSLHADGRSDDRGDAAGRPAGLFEASVLVCPTSTSTPAASFHPQITVGDEPTRVMCELVGPSTLAPSANASGTSH